MLLLFSLLFAYVHICLVLATTPPHYPILPISLNSLDLAGFEIAKSSWLTYTTKIVAGADDASAGDATELKGELDEDLGCCYVSFPDDQQWCPVGTIGDLCIWVVFFYFGSIVGPWLYSRWCMFNLLFVWSGIVSQLFIPFLFSTWDCVKITPLATKPPCGYASNSCLNTWEI